MRTLICVALAVCGAAAAGPLPESTAQAEGFSPARLDRVTQFLQAAVDRKQYAGAVTLIARRGHIVQWQGVGYRTDAIFQIYSMTKPITSVAALHAHRRLCSGREVERPGRRPPERRALG